MITLRSTSYILQLTSYILHRNCYIVHPASCLLLVAVQVSGSTLGAGALPDGQPAAGAITANSRVDLMGPTGLRHGARGHLFTRPHGWTLAGPADKKAALIQLDVQVGPAAHGTPSTGLTYGTPPTVPPHLRLTSRGPTGPHPIGPDSREPLHWDGTSWHISAPLGAGILTPTSLPLPASYILRPTSYVLHPTSYILRRPCHGRALRTLCLHPARDRSRHRSCHPQALHRPRHTALTDTVASPSASPSVSPFITSAHLAASLSSSAVFTTEPTRST